MINDNGARDQYVATGSQTVFQYTFEIFDKSDIAVEQEGVLLSEGTDYTVSNVGNDKGGNVTLTVGAVAGVIYTLYRDMALERLTDYQKNGDFLADEVNDDYDRLWAALQQAKSNNGAAIRASVSDTVLNSTNTVLATPLTRASKGLGFTATGELDYITYTSTGDSLNATNPLTPEMFGAVAGASDSILSFRELYTEANATNKDVYIPNSYTLTDSLDVGNVKTYGPGTLDFTTATALTINNSYVYAEGTVTQLGDLTGNLVKGDASITLDAPPALERGDTVFIVSTERWTDGRSYYTKGEAVTVHSVSGNQVDLMSVLYDNYTDSTCQIYKLNPVSTSFERVTIKCGNLDGSYGVRIKYGKGMDINCTVTGGGIAATQFEMCVESIVSGGRYIQTNRASGTTAGLDYGMVHADCQSFNVENAYLRGGRHGWTNGGFSVDFSTGQLAMITRNCDITNCDVGNDPQFGDHSTGGAHIQSLSWHANAEFCGFIDSFVQNGIVLSGNNNKIIFNGIEQNQAYTDATETPIT